MAVFLALVLPLAVALIGGAVVFGGKAARPMAIVGFCLAVFAICMVLVQAV